MMSEPCDGLLRELCDFGNKAHVRPAVRATLAAFMETLLFIEDDDGIRLALSMALEDEGYVVRQAPNGEDGLGEFRRTPPDLVLLDLRLPDMSGFDVCRALRAESIVPIIMITAQTDTHDMVAGLEAGADDYVTKPFSPREIVARVRAILRRSQPTSALPVDAGNGSILRHDSSAMRVHCHGEPLDLTAHEYKLLLVLLGRPGRVFTRDQLLEHAWQDPGAVTDRTIDAHVKSIRAKLRCVRAGAEDLIQTRRGLGYLLAL